MTRLLLVACAMLLASLSPAAAQYSFSGSPGALRTAPPQMKDKPAAAPNRATVSQGAPGLTGQTNRLAPQAAEGQRTQGPPQKPQSTRTPLNAIPGQARPVQGVGR